MSSQSQINNVMTAAISQMTNDIDTIADVNSKNDIDNSTDNPYGQSGEYSGTITDTTGYDNIIITINSDQNSKLNGIQILFCDTAEGIFEIVYQDTYIANINFNKVYSIINQYYVVKYINNDTKSQSRFNLISRLSTVANIENTVIKFDPKCLDFYNRLKSSNPETLMSIIFNNNSIKYFMLSDNLINGTIERNGASRILSTIGDSYGKVISQSKKYIVYQTGTSMLITITGNLNYSNSEDIDSMIGYFDDNDGFYYSYKNCNIDIIILNNGIAINIPQDSWNGDKLNGTGESGIIVQFNSLQEFFIEISNVNSVRFGINILGQNIICHTILNNNQISPLISNFNLPLRWSLSSNNAVEMLQSNASVISYGNKYNPIGINFSINNITITLTDDTETLLLGITGNDQYYHQQINLQSLNLISSINHILIRVYITSDISNFINFTNVKSDESYVRYTTKMDGLPSSSTIIYQTFINHNINVLFYSSKDFNFQIAGGINNNDCIFVTAERLNRSNSDITCVLNWNEVY